MTWQKSKMVGMAKDHDGRSYALEFRGERENTAAVVGPIPFGPGPLERVPTVHWEPSSDADDAFEKLQRWCADRDWTCERVKSREFNPSTGWGDPE